MHWYPGIQPHQVPVLPWPLASGLLAQIPSLEKRQNHMLAQTLAMWLNAHGGKRKRTPRPGDDPPLTEAELWTADELLRWVYVSLDGDEIAQKSRFDFNAIALKGIIRAVKDGLFIGQPWLELAPVFHLIRQTVGEV